MSMTSEKARKGNKKDRETGEMSNAAEQVEAGAFQTIAKYEDGLGEPHTVAYLKAGKRLVIIDTSSHWGERFLGSVSGQDEVDAMTDDYLQFAPDLTEPYCRRVNSVDLKSRDDGDE